MMTFVSTQQPRLTQMSTSGKLTLLPHH